MYVSHYSSRIPTHPFPLLNNIVVTLTEINLLVNILEVKNTGDSRNVNKSPNSSYVRITSLEMLQEDIVLF